MPDNEKPKKKSAYSLYNESYPLKKSNAVIEMERKSRAASKAARLAERDRAYAAHLAERGIPFETVTRPRDGGLTVHRRGNCPNYAGAEFRHPIPANPRPMKPVSLAHRKGTAEK